MRGIPKDKRRIKMKEKIIYTRWVATKLRNLGFKILRVEANPNKPEFDCYVFEETDELAAVLANLHK